jgi:Uma2 family endonuclease
MGVTNLTSADEYLKTSFDGVDREFAHGELIERAMPTKLHARIQALLCILFGPLVLANRLQIFTEMRLRLANDRFRIPDLCAYAADPAGDVPSTPPLLAIEISSHDDRLSETLRKLEEYLAFGVESIWLIDPEAKTFHTYDSTGLHPANELSLPAFNFTLTLASLQLQ